MGLTGTVGQLPLANLIINVTAETKTAMAQMKNLHMQTKKTGKKVNSKTGIMGIAMRGVIVAGATIAAIVSGIGVVAVGAWGIFKASSYYGMYSKMWANEATLISNEWVRRNIGVFDNLTRIIEEIRVEYRRDSESTLVGSIKSVLVGELTGNQSIGSILVTKGKGVLTTISQGFSWISSYIQLWVYNFLIPIYDFINNIFTTVNTIYTAIKNFIDAVWEALRKLPGI